MQQVLLALTEYWADLGCALAQPANTEVGAGTLNPATFLRVLGPEPWRMAYVESSVRPADSRYGDSPNRLATHTQFQVLLKPEPGNPQELFLGSLRALGIDPSRHDVRFVDDTWTARAVGAWGLGWEVWLDGQEVARLTYFQQAGGQLLDPVPVEISYGVERTVLALQRAVHVEDIAWAPGISYGELFGQAELERSTHFLDVADVATYRSLTELHDGEAARLIDAGLPVPAYGSVLRCAHALDVLDSRRAVGASERVRAFARMRELSGQVAELWLAHRAELGHPLGTVGRIVDPATGQGSSQGSGQPGGQPSRGLGAQRGVPAPVAVGLPGGEFPRTEGPEPLVFEVGFEELPAAQVPRTVAAIRAALTAKLAATRLRHGEITVVGSPRRVVAMVDEVYPVEEDYEQRIRGPRLRAAFDSSGGPTEAARAFARAHGAELHELRRMVADGDEYLAVVARRQGRGAAELLSGLLAEVTAGLRADTPMRWSAPGLEFARPIRWIVALLGTHVLPFAVSSLRSGRTTRLARTGPRVAIEVAGAAGYLELLYEHGVTADAPARRSKILARGEELARTVGGTVDPVAEGRVLDEVTNLVEQPLPVLGAFDEAYLALPADVLTTVMRTQLRHLPIRTRDGQLLPFFVAVADGDCDEQLVVAGNEAVLRARFADAAFMYENDLQTPPEQLAKLLGDLTFIEPLGSLADRSRRIAAIAADVAARVELSAEERHVLGRAGELAKFDLASQLVGELPGLAGVMAREYARQSGEPVAVALALGEIELPRRPGDELPTSLPGALLAMADRLDLLAGMFAIGSPPTGATDPFDLRGAALGAVAVLRSQPRLAGLTLEDALGCAVRAQPVELTAEARSGVVNFVASRFEQHLLDAGHAPEVVRAVLRVATSLNDAERTVAELGELLLDVDFQLLAGTMQRVCHIVPADAPPRYYPQIFTTPVEQELHDALVRVGAELAETPVALSRFAAVADALVEPIETFFADVLVMSEDPVIRVNRIGLLASIRELGGRVLAWDQLEQAL